LLDRRVVEFALRCPPGAFRAGGWDRPMFRRAVEPFLPREVVWDPGPVGGAPDRVTERSHPRLVELAELERLQQEADRTTEDLFGSFAG
jgi:hypothetical protein